MATRISRPEVAAGIDGQVFLRIPKLGVVWMSVASARELAKELETQCSWMEGSWDE